MSPRVLSEAAWELYLTADDLRELIPLEVCTRPHFEGPEAEQVNSVLWACMEELRQV